MSPTRMAPAALPVEVDDALARAAAELPRHQVLMHETGNVHAAAWCAASSAIAVVFEDIGSHNALDKLIGHLVMHEIDLRSDFAFMSSRASYELARKAPRVSILMLATISAASSLAIDIASQAGLKLASFCR